MEEKLNAFLKDLERKLMEAPSRDEAYNLIKNYDKQSLEVIQDYLKAYTKSKSRHAILASIVHCTYDVYQKTKVIKGLDLHKK